MASNTRDSVRRARPLLGTFVEITAHGGETRRLERAVEAAFDAIERVQGLMSYQAPDSDVSRLNRTGGCAPIAIHPWTYSVLRASLELQARSKGLFNIAVAPALERLGLLPGSLASSARASPGQQVAVELSADKQARLRVAGSKIDLGGIAKGFAVDQALRVLRDHDALGGLVNAGGDLAAFGMEDNVIQIRDPRDPTRLLASAALRDGALASSGLPFDPVVSGRSAHCAIIDPRTCAPVTAISGASVRAASCMVADALTKVVMLAGTAASDVLDAYGASALIANSGGQVLVTTNWQWMHPLAA
jgi:FAD:protein FMN transferase